MERENYLTITGVYIVLLAYYIVALDSLLGISPLSAFLSVKYGDLGYIVILIISAALLLILIPLLKRVQEPEISVTQNKYRIYSTALLTIISILSILLLSRKVIESPIIGPPFLKEFSPIVPPIIVVSAVTIFIAVTSYMKRFYPYSAIFASALLGVIYVVSLTFVTPRYSKEWSLAWLIAYFSVFPIIVIVSSWHGEKLGTAYPIALSAVLGVVAGVEIPQGIEGFLEMLALIILSIILILLSGITILVLVLAKSKFKYINEHLILSLKKSWFVGGSIFNCVTILIRFNIWFFL